MLTTKICCSWIFCLLAVRSSRFFLWIAWDFLFKTASRIISTLILLTTKRETWSRITRKETLHKFDQNRPYPNPMRLLTSLWYISQFHLRPESPSPGLPPGISIFFLPWMANSRGWGLLNCQMPRGGTKKEGKCPVLRQHCNIRELPGDGDRTGGASLEQRQPSLPSKIRTVRSRWIQEDGALEDSRRGNMASHK